MHYCSRRTGHLFISGHLRTVLKTFGRIFTNFHVHNNVGVQLENRAAIAYDLTEYFIKVVTENTEQIYKLTLIVNH